MKRLVVAVLSLTLAASCASAEAAKKLSGPKEQLSYSLGYDIGTNFKRNEIDVDPAIVVQGMKDAEAGKPQMTPEEMRAVITELQQKLRAKQQEMMAKQMEKRKEEGEKNKKEGEAFLAANKRKEGVKTLPDGLQYIVLNEGTGKKPAATDTVTVKYRGTLIDGTEFDSSEKHGKDATFGLNQVIKGWTEGVQLIKEGGKIRLFVPPDLGYGERGAGGLIGPDATLIFDVELISVKQAEKEAAPAETKEKKH